jgi:hypothetical protein
VAGAAIEGAQGGEGGNSKSARRDADLGSRVLASLSAPARRGRGRASSTHLHSGAAYFAQRHLFNSPNVHVSGEARRMSIKPKAEHEEVARRFTQHRESLAKLAPGYTGKPQ